ncbi:MAG: OmpA family protein [Alphaproteobacteria bacterium]|nr:OmpA family protein [Alphaproteobacteria bacterium]MCZ6591295.1 OmpA family protein [Alphaproteobacteria bacterium]
MVVAQVTNVLSSGNAKSARILVVLSLAAILAGCSSVSEFDVFGIFDDGPPATTTAGQASVRASGDQTSAAASQQQTPSLSSVPARPDAVTPPDVRQRVVEGLAADRENARYSDQAIRLQGTSRENAAATTAPAPPPVGTSVDRRTGSATQISPAPRTQTASASLPPAPIPLTTGPRPSVIVDPTALDGGSSFPFRASRVTIDEQVATIHFAHSSSKLDDRDKLVIAQVASAQRQNNAEIVVIGHASGRTQQLDKVEHELANFRISLARANRVAAQLISMGVAAEKVRVEAFSDDSRLYSETMPTGEAGNRRAEIYFRQ